MAENWPDIVLRDYIDAWPIVVGPKMGICPPKPPQGYPLSQESYEKWMATFVYFSTMFRKVSPDSTYTSVHYLRDQRSPTPSLEGTT